MKCNKTLTNLIYQFICILVPVNSANTCKLCFRIPPPGTGAASPSAGTSSQPPCTPPAPPRTSAASHSMASLSQPYSTPPPTRTMTGISIRKRYEELSDLCRSENIDPLSREGTWNALLHNAIYKQSNLSYVTTLCSRKKCDIRAVGT